LSYASTFSSGQVGLVLVNKSTTPQTIGVNFTNFTPGNRFYWYTLQGSNDNGDFSRKVIVNGNQPTNATGGPTNYATLKPNSALCENNVKVSLPGLSAVFVLVERNSSTTPVSNVNVLDKQVQLVNNPSGDGSFSLRFTGFSPAEQFDIKMTDAAGRVVYNNSSKNIQVLNVQHRFPAGVYFIKVNTAKGATVKKLIVK
jgi:hypothetical protein